MIYIQTLAQNGALGLLSFGVGLEGPVIHSEEVRLEVSVGEVIAILVNESTTAEAIGNAKDNDVKDDVRDARGVRAQVGTSKDPVLLNASSPPAFSPAHKRAPAAAHAPRLRNVFV